MENGEDLEAGLEEEEKEFKESTFNSK